MPPVPSREPERFKMPTRNARNGGSSPPGGGGRVRTPRPGEMLPLAPVREVGAVSAPGVP